MPPLSLSPSFPLSTLKLLVPGAAAALALAMLGGHALGTDGDSPWLGIALAIAALATLLRTLWSCHLRMQAVIEQSTTALRQLGQGRTAFRLDGQGLTDFDPLLLAIDDLRETVHAHRA